MVCVIQIAELTVFCEHFRHASFGRMWSVWYDEKVHGTEMTFLLLCEVAVLVNQHGGDVCQKSYVS